MSFNYNPYNHIELVRVKAGPEDEAVRLASYMLGYRPGDNLIPERIPVTVLDQARAALEAGYTPPERLEGDLWRWHCHSCGGDGKDPSADLAKLIDSFESHLIASHNRDRDSFEGWSDY